MSEFDLMPDFLAGLERDLRRRAAEGSVEVMPDYLTGLEQDLRRRAAATGASSRRRHAARWRRPVFALAFAASLLAQALMVPAPVVHETPAFGSPPILGVPSIRVPPQLRGRGMFADKGETPTEAWAISAFGGTAYVARNADLWCLWMPDYGLPSRSPPAGACSPSSEFLRDGIAIKLGHRYLALLPTSGDHPTLRHADGTTETLDPTPEGVVAVEMRPGDRIFVRRGDGTTRVDRNYALDAGAADTTTNTTTTTTTTNTTDDEEG